MSTENRFNGRADHVSQIGEANTVNVYSKPKRTKLFVIGYVVAVLLVVGGVGVYFLTRSQPLEMAADYHPEPELPAAVHPRPLDRTEFPSDKDCRAVAKWAVEQDGAHASGQPVRLWMRGRGVDVNRIRVVVTERLEPPAGTLLRCMSSGANPTVKLKVDLDADQPIVRDSGSGKIYAADTAITLNDEAMFFDIEPTTVKCLCRWHIEVEHHEGGKLVTTPVKAPGDKEFETAAAERVVHAYSALGSMWSQER
jgi:hypothetical protein